MSRLAYEDTSGLPLHRRTLKPEAARSLFPRLIDRNQNVQSIIIFRASQGYSLMIGRRTARLARAAAPAPPPIRNGMSRSDNSIEESLLPPPSRARAVVSRPHSGATQLRRDQNSAGR